MNYHFAFIHVIKSSTIHLILSIAVQNQWSLQYIDVSYAFLQGYLDEQVYLRKPSNFEHSNHHDYDC